MPSQLRFEGPDLEELLDRVRTEVGSDARIVAANKVRKGGIGGFFTREYFEVVLEGDEAADGTSDGGPTAPVQEVPAPVGSRGRSRRAGAGAPPERGPQRPATRSVPASVLERPTTSILDLAEDVNEVERRRTPRPLAPAASTPSGPDDEVIDLREGPRVSTQSDRFASILERLAREATAGDADDAHDDDDADADGYDADGYDADEFVADDHHRPAMNGSARAVALTTRSVAPRRIGTAVRPTEDAPELRVRAEAAEIAADEQRRAATAASVAAATAAASGLTPMTAAASAALEAPVVRRREVAPPDVIERPENRLARLGVPARMIPRNVHPRELQGALIESLAKLPVPTPLPNSNGVVVAVVGLGASAVVLARELSEELGLDPDRVVLATSEPLGEGVPSWLQINDAETAEERRRSWRRRGTPTVVAVTVPSGRAGLGWARAMLDDLEPTLVWAIVEAGWKAEDVRHWEERLGGIDVLQLTRLDETVSPAAVLDLGIPVGRLERHVATPVAWAELLLYRMGAER